MGELSVRKNQRIIFEALSQLKEEGRLGETVYLAVGEGEKKEEYKEIIVNSNLERHAMLLGHRNDVDELCKAADCFVHPSVREGLGIAPLEAMATGLPLISSYVNGIRDYTEDGVSGCCIDPMNVEQLAEAILKIKNDSSFREKCSNNNIIKAKEFDVENTNSIIKKVYEEELQAKSCGLQE